MANADKMIRFSIVTVTYNAGELLRRTAETVLAQTYPCVEHLIIDGCSKDNTVEIAREYKDANDEQDNGHEVIVVSEPDKGLYDAMNKGLRRATGDYILFLNAGDGLLSESTLERIAGCVGEGEELPAVLYGDTDIVDANYRFLRHRRLSPPEKLSWRSFRRGMLVCHQAFYARLDIAREQLYDDRYRYSADVDWCIRVMKEAEKRRLPLRNVNAVVAEYLEEGQTTANHKASLKERFTVMKRHYGLVQTIALHIWFVFRAVLKK